MQPIPALAQLTGQPGNIGASEGEKGLREIIVGLLRTEVYTRRFA